MHLTRYWIAQATYLTCRNFFGFSLDRYIRTILEIPVHFPTDQPQKIHFWTGYNSSLSEFKSEFSIVTDAPIIESKPNDMSTLYTTMKKCVDMTKAMGQKYSVQTFDQQLYSIAKQVAWAMPDTFRNHILRLSGFHTPSCYIAAIGKLWGDGGLKDLLVDSSVYAARTVDQMLNGKEINRNVRALTLAYEALSVSWLDAFFSWCVENDLMKSFPGRCWSCLSEVASNFHSVTEIKTSIDVAMDAIERYMLPLMEDFRQYGCNASPTFKVWDMLHNAIEIMLQNI